MRSHHQNNHAGRALKAGAFLVPLLISILLAGSVLFYKERMLFIDSPHIFFRIVNDGIFRIEENRFGSFITQLFPLVGAQLHIPFKLLLILYSASFYLFYLAVALLLVFRFRNYSLAVLFGLYLTLFVSETFYWPNNEVHQGMAWLMLVFALNAHIAEKKWNPLISIPVFILSFALAIWTHPLVMLVAAGLWVFTWVGKCNWLFNRWQSVLFFVFLLALSLLKFSAGQHHGYDSTKIEEITRFDWQQIRSLFTSLHMSFFVKSCFSNYWLFLILYIIGIVAMLREKKYVLTLLTMAWSVGYLLLVVIAFRDLNGNRFYIESEYMPLSVICCAPFVYYVLPKLSAKTTVSILAFVFLVRLVYIFNAAQPFSHRVVLLDHMLNKMKEKGLTKIIVPEPFYDADAVLISHWGTPVESIILSKLKGEMPQRTFAFLDAASIRAVERVGTDTLLGCWEKRSPQQVNAYYFQPDRTVPYKIVSYSELMQ